MRDFFTNVCPADTYELHRKYEFSVYSMFGLYYVKVLGKYSMCFPSIPSRGMRVNHEYQNKNTRITQEIYTPQ